MKHVIFLLVFVLSIGGVLALDACSDTNEIDISQIPCLGLTNVVSCTGNISVNNINTSEEINLTTEQTFDSRLNFTVNLSQGSYSLVDCDNNSAVIIVGLFEQGFGINLFIIILPAIILSFISLFFSWRLFESLNESDQEHIEILESGGDVNDFTPSNRFLPIVFMLFSFVPLTFMIGFVNNNLVKYIDSNKITTFYSNFFIYFSWTFFLVFLLMVVVWVAGFIKKVRIDRGIGDE